MRVFIIGITGGVGRALARKLGARGDAVSGLVRTENQRCELAAHGVDTRVGDLACISAGDLAKAFADADTIVFTAGSNGGDSQATKAIDGDAVAKATRAAHIAGIQRFILVSVFPESWRERDLGEKVEFYFAVKKDAEIALTRSDLDWLIVRPSLLLDEPETGAVSLGPAEFHGQIPRGDVAETLVELLRKPSISRQILEVTTGGTPIRDAVGPTSAWADRRRYLGIDVLARSRPTCHHNRPANPPSKGDQRFGPSDRKRTASPAPHAEPPHAVATPADAC